MCITETFRGGLAITSISFYQKIIWLLIEIVRSQIYSLKDQLSSNYHLDVLIYLFSWLICSFYFFYFWFKVLWFISPYIYIWCHYKWWYQSCRDLLYNNELKVTFTTLVVCGFLHVIIHSLIFLCFWILWLKKVISLYFIR